MYDSFHKITVTTPAEKTIQEGKDMVVYDEKS